MHAHLHTPAGREFSVFASFFQVVKGKEERLRTPLYAHSLTWAISDVQERRYFSESRVDPDAPRVGLDRMKKGDGTRDQLLRRAMREVLKRGSVPAPDRIFDGDVRVARDKLDLDYDTVSLTKRADGSYHLAITCEKGVGGADGKVAASLVFRPQKAPLRHGDNGVVRGLDGSELFYYFIPRSDVRGTVTVDDDELPVTGTGWYDHEFGGYALSDDGSIADSISDRVRAAGEGAWTWMAVQLDDGTEITAYDMVVPETGQRLEARALIVDADGTRRDYPNVTISVSNWWRSTRTFSEYPTSFHLSVPDADLELDLKAVFPDQELITLISKPAFWEGRCDASGSRGGRALEGRGFVERNGFPTVETLEEFFAAVGEEVRRSVQHVLPFNPPYELVRDMIATEERDHLMRGVSIPNLEKSMIRPVREIVDRGGKSWRSYAALACCDIVGGDSRLYVEWLAFPELMHVGSLIVDDVEDGSQIRRGGKSCHEIYGEPLAINAGTAAYFMGHKLLKNKNLADKDLLRIYDLYFEALRAGHAGQALDLYGLDADMDAVVESGDGDAIEDRVLAIHRLKTAGPAAALARMGAVAGGGNDTQVHALGEYFESVGLAFQIMDDVLNLRGFKGDLKTRGEDISRGIITLPVAKGISRMKLSERRAFWEALKAKPEDSSEVSALIDQLEACGAIEACAVQARRLVEEAWTGLDPVVEDSLPKLMLRAFGWYVLERQY